MADIPPSTIKLPSVKELDQGSEESTILKQAKLDGEACITQARALMAADKFTEATEAAKHAHKSFAWVAKFENQDPSWEITSGISQLEHEIHKRRSLRAGDEMLANARKQLRLSNYQEALELFRGSCEYYRSAEAEERLREVETLIADTEGEELLLEFQACVKEEKYEECLKLLDRAEIQFSKAPNVAKRHLVVKERAKIQGDLKIQEFQPACEQYHYDAAVKILIEAVKFYNQAGKCRATHSNA